MTESKEYFGRVVNGKLIGHEIEQISPDLFEFFDGQFVVLTITGVIMTPDKLRGWYFAGIIPAILRIHKAQGNYSIDPKGKEFIDGVHKALKRRFLLPERNPDGTVKLKNGQQIYTTKNLGRLGWTNYVRDVLQYVEQEHGVRLYPKDPKGGK